MLQSSQALEVYSDGNFLGFSFSRSAGEGLNDRRREVNAYGEVGGSLDLLQPDAGRGNDHMYSEQARRGLRREIDAAVTNLFRMIRDNRPAEERRRAKEHVDRLLHLQEMIRRE